MTRMNAIWNCKNPHQGNYTKVLCVCSAGLLRSPTIAYVLGEKGYNTRAAGVHDYALIPVDDVLLMWADMIVTAEEEHKNILKRQYDLKDKEIISLDLPDKYPYRDPELIKLITQKWAELYDE